MKMRWLVIFVILVGMLVPPLTSAQEQLLPDLEGYYDVLAVGVRVYHPAGWVSSETDAVFIAENETDLAAAMDDDPSTKAVNFTYQIRFAAVTDLGFTAETSLDDIVADLVTGASITVEEQFDFPVMSFRSIFLTGTNADGNIGALSMWLQNGNLVMLSFNIPNQLGFSSDVYGTLGAILGSVQPIISETLEMTELLPVEALGTSFNIVYPKGWVGEATDATNYHITELESDVALLQDSATVTAGNQVVIAVAENDPQITSALLIQGLEESGAIENILTTNQHMVLGEVEGTSVIAYNPENDLPFGVFAAAKEGKLFLMIARSPDETSFLEFYPTFIYMLESFQFPAE